MQYHDPPLVLTENSISDADGVRTVEDLPDPEPGHTTRLAAGPAIIGQLWKVALDDIEHNTTAAHESRLFRDDLRMRELALAGMLGVNRLYPCLMLDTIKRRLESGSDVDHAWISCTEALLRGTDNYEWQWLYKTAGECLADNQGERAAADDSLIGNCFYLRALQTMVRVADLLGRFAHVYDWQVLVDEQKEELARMQAAPAQQDALGMALAARDGCSPASEPEAVDSALIATLQLVTLERRDATDRTAQNAALLARTVRQDGFHSAADSDSPGHDLCTAAAFVNVCLRADLLAQHGALSAPAAR